MLLNRFASAVVGLSLGAASFSALAGSNDVNSTLTRLFPLVSFSTSDGKPVYGYRIDLNTIGTTNTQNKVSLTIDTLVVDAAGDAVGGQTSGFAFGDGAAFDTYCKAAKPGATSITCSFGQLKSGAQIPSFFVYFTAPAAGNFVQIAGIARFAEQRDGSGEGNSTTPSSYSPSGSPTEDTPPSATYGNFVEVGTEETTRTEIKSGLSKAQPALQIGTSKNAAGQTEDLVKTTLKLPPAPPLTGGASYTNLNIFEGLYEENTTALNNCANGAGFVRCYKVQLDILGLQFPATTYTGDDSKVMTAAYYFEPSALKNSFNENKVVVLYEDELNLGTFKTLVKCSTDPALPCIERAVFFKKKNDLNLAPPGIAVELNGYLVVVKQAKNGFTRFF